MHLDEINYNYKTKKNEPIKFRYEHEIDRIWQIDHIDAYVMGRHAGYIKTAYIPRKIFANSFPSLLHFKIRHNYNFNIPNNLTKLNENELKRIFKYIQSDYRPSSDKEKSLLKPSNWGLYSLKDDISKQELLFILYSYSEKLLTNRDLFNGYLNFKNFQVDKPYVDYIKVFNPLNHTNKKDSFKNDDWINQGVGSALYIKMAEYQKSKGLKLYASNIQSDQAKRAWNRFNKIGLVKKEETTIMPDQYNKNKETKPRYYLDI